MTIRSAAAGICLVLQLGCAELSDPAVRLARCLESAVKESRAGATFNTSCNLALSGTYLVVLHPEGDVDDEHLVSAGVPLVLVPEVRELRLTDGPAIYVVAADPTVVGTGTERSIRSSRTTYQAKFVRIPRLMALVKTTQPVEVAVGGAPDARVIESIR